MLVSRETSERLEAYKSLLIRWNPSINLVAQSTVADIQARHIQDCAQLIEHIDSASGVWVDLGSGGGLPGIVLAIAFVGRPVEFRLVESDQRKAAFLRTAIRTLDLPNAKVENKRIEKIEPLNASNLSARALAPLPRLMTYLHQHLSKSGQAWIMKGENWREEVELAYQDWSFNVFPIPSKSRPGAAILRINGVANAAS